MSYSKPGDVKAAKAVEQALLWLATGGEAVEEKTIVEQGVKGETVRQETLKKRVTPDLKAIQYWLEHRGGARWSRSEGDGEGGVTLVHEVPRPDP